MQAVDYKIIQTVAEKAYDGVYFQSGQSVMEHCSIIANVFGRQRCYELAAVALLHEVYRMTELTATDLVDVCVFGPVRETLDFLVQRDDETIIDYYSRISQDKIAKAVAAADITLHAYIEPDSFRQQIHGMLLLTGWRANTLMCDAVYDYLDVPKELRGFGDNQEKLDYTTIGELYGKIEEGGRDSEGE